MMPLIIVIGLLVLAGLIWLARMDGDYHVRRSMWVRVDAEQAFDKLRDFKTWADWSPWLMHEPEAMLEFSETPDQEGGWYSWDGRLIGAGRLMHQRFEAPERIEQRIEFTRPFKAVCEVYWEIEADTGGTRLHWNMKGRMPFFFRPMVKRLKMMVGKDYELGLALLAGELDAGFHSPRIAFKGRTQHSAQHALTCAFAGGVADIEKAMSSGFDRLLSHVAAHERKPLGAPFAAYHKVEIETMYFECDMAVPVDESMDPGEFEPKSLGGGDYYEVTLSGSYDYMEQAWYSAIGHVRMMKLKMDSSRPNLEIYRVGPPETDQTDEFVTSLMVPIR